MIVLFLLILSFSQVYSQAGSTLYGYVDSTTFREAETHPAFVGGDKAWETFLKKEIHYHGRPATVIVEFTVSKDEHTPKEITVYRSDNPHLNNEAIRLMKKTRWVPAIANGRAVDYRMRQEIEFK